MNANNAEQKILTNVKRAVHDLNNIFTSNLTSIEQLQKLLAENENAQNLLTGLSINSTRAIEIINSLSPTSKKLKRRISIENILTDVHSTVKSSLENRISLKINIEKNLPKTEGYYTDLYRAFLNLTINAIESIDDKGLIEIRANNTSKNNFVDIYISDSGSGISDENLPSIFDIEFSTKARESGQGLTIVKEIIEEHNGSISAKSLIGSGTTFTITLPTIPSPQKKPLGKKIQNILLVDDDKTILELFSDLLFSYNYNVISVDGGKKALNKFKNTPSFDLIIIDKFMPDMDGLDLIKKIRESNSETPIILTSGSHETIEQDLTYLGINKKIKKPYDFEEMLDEIQNLLA
ncbi:MAG: response regulator [Melioribacteraceae bacterium]|nr:response regulator [Melioribacteraceae bacterium]